MDLRKLDFIVGGANRAEEREWQLKKRGNRDLFKLSLKRSRRLTWKASRVPKEERMGRLPGHPVPVFHASASAGALSKGPSRCWGSGDECSS